MAIFKIKASEGQSIYDVNNMYYSGFDNIVKFCKDNNVENLNDLDMSSRTLEFDTNINPDLSSTSIINSRGLVFKTGKFLESVRVTDAGDYRITNEGYTRILH